MPAAACVAGAGGGGCYRCGLAAIGFATEVLLHTGPRASDIKEVVLTRFLDVSIPALRSLSSGVESGNWWRSLPLISHFGDAIVNHLVRAAVCRGDQAFGMLSMCYQEVLLLGLSAISTLARSTIIKIRNTN